MSISTELTYVVLHLCNILFCSSYQLCIYISHRFLYDSFEPKDRAFLDHEYTIVTRENETLFIRLYRLFCMTFNYLFPHFTYLGRFSSLRAERTDNPSVAFLRIVQTVSRLPTSSKRLNVSLNNKLKRFWYRGIIGASKPDHFLLGGRWHIKDIPDPREKLGNDPLLCAIAASTAEQMVEIFNWRIELGVRRDLRMIRATRPFWDENLEPCEMESDPEWCEHVGPVQVQAVVDREVGEDTARDMLKSVDLSPSFKKRNLLADSQFMYFE